MITSVLLMMAQAASATPAATSPGTNREVVVTGTRLADSERAWRDCIARRCPADQEIEAALAHGENLFVAGRYADARATVGRTIDRTRGAAKQFPVLVADLHRADANIAGHMGETDQVRMAQIASLDALRAGLPRNDPRILAQALEIGNGLLTAGRPFAAIDQWEAVANEARKGGAATIEGDARLRVARFWTRQALSSPGIYGGRAKQAIRRLAAGDAPALEPFRQAARQLEAQLATANGDAGAIARAATTAGSGRLTLIYDPRMKLRPASSESINVGAGVMTSDARFQDQWIDVGFRVMPDGKVAEATLLRDSGRLQGDWAKAVVTSVASRRYAAIGGEGGQYRVERYTYTADWFLPTGSHLRIQNGVPRIMVLDLTVDPTPGAVSGKG